MKNFVSVVAVMLVVMMVKAMPQRFGYYVATPASFANLEDQISFLDVISMNTWTLNSGGSGLLGSVDQNALTYITDYKNFWHGTLKTLVCFRDFSTKKVHTLLNSVPHQTNVINQIVAILDSNTNIFKGVNVNLGGIALADKSKFTSFITNLATILHARGEPGLLVVSVPPTEPIPAPSAASYSGGYDYYALGQVVDFVEVMTYDMHGRLANPNPISDVRLVRAHMEFALSQVEASKVTMAINAFGYDWNLTKSKSTLVNYAVSVPGAVVQYDGDAQAPWLTYKVGQAKHKAYYENEASITAKVQLANEFGFGGIAVSHLGNPDYWFWSNVLSTLVDQV
jgi:spore germination protein YaaH